jgi:hypothetical protein
MYQVVLLSTNPMVERHGQPDVREGTPVPGRNEDVALDASGDESPHLLTQVRVGMGPVLSWPHSRDNEDFHAVDALAARLR